MQAGDCCVLDTMWSLVIGALALYLPASWVQRRACEGQLPIHEDRTVR